MGAGGLVRSLASCTSVGRIFLNSALVVSGTFRWPFLGYIFLQNISGIFRAGGLADTMPIELAYEEDSTPAAEVPAEIERPDDLQLPSPNDNVAIARRRCAPVSAPISITRVRRALTPG